MSSERFYGIYFQYRIRLVAVFFIIMMIANFQKCWAHPYDLHFPSAEELAEEHDRDRHRAIDDFYDPRFDRPDKVVYRIGDFKFEIDREQASEKDYEVNNDHESDLR